VLLSAMDSLGSGASGGNRLIRMKKKKSHKKKT
jgi:hypothetical protein